MNGKECTLKSRGTVDPLPRAFSYSAAEFAVRLKLYASSYINKQYSLCLLQNYWDYRTRKSVLESK